MLIDFGDIVIDTSKASTIRKNGKYISFTFGRCDDVISFFLEDEKKVTELYDKIVSSIPDVLSVNSKAKKNYKKKKAE